MSDIFLSAEWKHLAMLNYEVDPTILAKRIPPGTELDLFQGRALASIVGFIYLKTRVLGFPIPFHTNFEELNLRFYVKRKHPDGDRRAVAFVKEIVPSWATAFVARTLYNENFVVMPMRHAILDKPKEFSAHYGWKNQGHWENLCVRCAGDPAIPAKGSEAEFITEHYWGYAAQKGGGTMEYKVAHPQWRCWTPHSFDFEADVKALYGAEFYPFLRKPPVSVLLAEGSPVTVTKGVKF